MFFATIGLNAQISDLFKGRRLLVLLLGLTLAFMVRQNLIGVLGVTLFGLPSATSVLAGSASLIDGYGTTIAWGSQIEELTGSGAAPEMGVASASRYGCWLCEFLSIQPGVQTHVWPIA